ncbi:hypothetical protein ACJX0J_029579, partial [Zea mays]
SCLLHTGNQTGAYINYPSFGGTSVSVLKAACSFYWSPKMMEQINFLKAWGLTQSGSGKPITLYSIQSDPCKLGFLFDLEMKDEEAGAKDHKKMIYWMLSKMTTAIFKFRKIWAMILKKGSFHIMAAQRMVKILKVTLLRIHQFT